MVSPKAFEISTKEISLMDNTINLPLRNAAIVFNVTRILSHVKPLPWINQQKVKIVTLKLHNEI